MDVLDRIRISAKIIFLPDLLRKSVTKRGRLIIRNAVRKCLIHSLFHRIVPKAFRQLINRLNRLLQIHILFGRMDQRLLQIQNSVFLCHSAIQDIILPLFKHRAYIRLVKPDRAQLRCLTPYLKNGRFEAAFCVDDRGTGDVDINRSVLAGGEFGRVFDVGI